MLTPAPGPSPSDEQALDDILSNIDRLADHVTKKATDRHPPSPAAAAPPPTQVFSPERVKKTKMLFQTMSESDFSLDESNGSLPAINGAEEEPIPTPKADPPRKRWPWKRAVSG